MEARYNAANAIYAELSKTNQHFNKLYSSLTRVPQRVAGLDAGR
jgi:hypothetical protein